MPLQQFGQFQQLIDTITPEIYANLKRAVEIGKWPDGRALSTEQRELCMQAVILYETQYIDTSEHTGFIDRGSKAENALCDDESGDEGDAEHSHAHDVPVTLKWTE